MRYLSLTVLVLFGLSANTCLGANSCKDQLQNPIQLRKRVLKTFQMQYTKIYYKSGLCAVNTIRMAEALLEEVPELKSSDFKVHIVSPTALYPDSEAILRPFETRRSRQSASEGNSFAYHVFLEFDGFVLDMDNGPQPAAFPLGIYLKRFFKLNDEPLLVWSIPGQYYFRLLPRFNWEQMSFWVNFRKLTTQFEPKNLKDLAQP